MEPAEVERAIKAGATTASALGLRVDDAVIINNSNRIAVRLTPCEVLARVAPPVYEASAELEVLVAHRLAEAHSPIAEPDPRVEPRVHVRDGFVVTLWTYYEPLLPSDIAPAAYADALAQLHAGLRQVDTRAPHFTDQVAEAQRLVGDREQTPELIDADRELLASALGRLGTMIGGTGPDDQLLHGDAHVSNVLATRQGLRFIDLEDCCHGPVEFDIAHGPLPSNGHTLLAEEICEHYPGADRDLIAQCHILTWAMITTWRWRRGDDLPNSRYWATEGLNRLRVAADRLGLDISGGKA